MNMYPLVSILIPTYNRPYYLEQALKSALDQTYPNIEIIICDNSDDDRTKQLVKARMSSPQNAQIKYVKNARNIGPIENQQKCLKLSTGEYINYLMDDDLLHPEKIEKMLPYLADDDKVSLVTSPRHIIDSSNQPIRTSSRFMRSPGKESFFFGRTVIKKMLYDQKNYIGEPTTPLFRRSGLQAPFGVFLGYQANNSVDVATWLTILSQDNAVFLSEPLSSYRKHRDQLANSTLSQMGHICDWIMFTSLARKNDLFIDAAALADIVQMYKKPVLGHFLEWDEATGSKYIDELMRRVTLIIEICDDNQLHKPLASMASDFKVLLEQLDRRKKTL